LLFEAAQHRVGTSARTDVELAMDGPDKKQATTWLPSPADVAWPPHPGWSMTLVDIGTPARSTTLFDVSVRRSYDRPGIVEPYDLHRSCEFVRHDVSVYATPHTRYGTSAVEQSTTETTRSKQTGRGAVLIYMRVTVEPRSSAHIDGYRAPIINVVATARRSGIKALLHAVTIADGYATVIEALVRAPTPFRVIAATRMTQACPGVSPVKRWLMACGVHAPAAVKMVVRVG
jgi:hypothetical protein